MMHFAKFGFLNPNPHVIYQKKCLSLELQKHTIHCKFVVVLMLHGTFCFIRLQHIIVVAMNKIVIC